MSIDDGDQYFEYENGEYQGDDYEEEGDQESES
jgi:hypothetical protein